MTKDFDYDTYEKECERIRKENEPLVLGFIDELRSNGLSSKTVRTHAENVDFYVNQFLLRYDPVPATGGCQPYYLDDFLGYFFIRKCMWSTPASIKQNCTSLKKFYAYLAGQGLISQESLKEMNAYIRENVDVWAEDCRKYNDPINHDDIFGFGF